MIVSQSTASNFLLTYSNSARSPISHKRLENY